MGKLSIIYMVDKTRFSMQFLADILKIMKEKIVKIFNQKIRDINEEIKFLVFIDCLFKKSIIQT